ncbi:MAG: Trk system potassium transporter TrkA [Bdellovibrionales bacterium]|nr:Trk system potassium transporter TrkA [Bdellovibrionales bacterium]
MRFIVLGAGDVGTTLSAQLVREQHDVVLIERDEAKLAAAAAMLDVQALVGNGCLPEVLEKAGLNTADYFIAVANQDEINITACITAKLLNPAAKRIARIRGISFAHKDIVKEHVDEFFDLTINPIQAAADYLLRLLKVAGAREVIDFCEGKLQVIGLDVKSHSPFLGRKLKELANLREKLHLLIIAIVRDGELVVPRGNDELLEDDTVYCITPPERIGMLFEMVGSTFAPAKSAMIWGGGPLGRTLAHELEAQGIQVKLIISKKECSNDLLDEFHDILVLTGDGKDRDLLLEENIHEIDAFVSVTPDEEDNILSALLAKKLGARTSMALVNKASYLPLVQAIGVDVVVSSRAAAASAIFAHIHTEALISEFSLRYLGAGFIEVVVEAQMPIAGKTISQAKFPHGILCASMTRGDDLITPTGSTTLQPGDHLILFITRGAHTKLEKLFGKKVEIIT